MRTILFLFIMLFACIANAQDFYSIPKQNIKPFEILDDSSNSYFQKNKKCIIEVDSFEVSSQITLGQFKEYITDIQEDSAALFCLSQWPDSTIASKENYHEYITNKSYDAYPAAGISWDAAMNFCKWKTLKENKKDSIKFIYRLPKFSEWLASFSYLNSQKIKNDFSQYFSDWLMQLYFEGGSFSNPCEIHNDFLYYPVKGDPPRMHRMTTLGSSYYFQPKMGFRKGYYTFKGYRHIAFRIIKVYLNKSLQDKSFNNKILDSWGITNR